MGIIYTKILNTTMDMNSKKLLRLNGAIRIKQTFHPTLPSYNSSFFLFAENKMRIQFQ